MNQFDIFLEPFRNGSYISHMAYVFDTAYTLCGLPIERLKILEGVGAIVSLIECPRCKNLVEVQIPDMLPHQINGWEGQDGR